MGKMSPHAAVALAQTAWHHTKKKVLSRTASETRSYRYLPNGLNGLVAPKNEVPRPLVVPNIELPKPPVMPKDG